jgi:hypothetical protein
VGENVYVEVGGTAEGVYVNVAVLASVGTCVSEDVCVTVGEGKTAVLVALGGCGVGL